MDLFRHPPMIVHEALRRLAKPHVRQVGVQFYEPMYEGSKWGRLLNRMRAAEAVDAFAFSTTVDVFVVNGVVRRAPLVDAEIAFHDLVLSWFEDNLTIHLGEMRCGIVTRGGDALVVLCMPATDMPNFENFVRETRIMREYVLANAALSGVSREHIYPNPTWWIGVQATSEKVLDHLCTLVSLS